MEPMRFRFWADVKLFCESPQDYGYPKFPVQHKVITYLTHFLLDQSLDHDVIASKLYYNDYDILVVYSGAMPLVPRINARKRGLDGKTKISLKEEIDHIEDFAKAVRNHVNRHYNEITIATRAYFWHPARIADLNRLRDRTQNIESEKPILPMVDRIPVGAGSHATDFENWLSDEARADIERSKIQEYIKQN
jgi:hypothetical protein